jgi:hypothetical protein
MFFFVEGVFIFYWTFETPKNNEPFFLSCISRLMPNMIKINKIIQKKTHINEILQHYLGITFWTRKSWNSLHNGLSFPQKRKQSCKSSNILQ